MATVRWHTGPGISQVWMFLSCYVLPGFPRNQGLSKGLSASFPLGIIIQGASVKGRACHRQMERQCPGCPWSGGLIDPDKAHQLPLVVTSVISLSFNISILLFSFCTVDLLVKLRFSCRTQYPCNKFLFCFNQPEWTSVDCN